VTPFIEDAQPGDKVMCQDEHRNDTSGATGPIRGQIDRKAEPKCMDPFNRRLVWGARSLDLQLPQESCRPPLDPWGRGGTPVCDPCPRPRQGTQLTAVSNSINLALIEKPRTG